MNEPQLSGWLVDRQHFFPLRVYYAETDAGGVVYHAAYLQFAERARTEMMRLVNLDLGHLLDREGLLFAVRHCAIDYLRAAQLDDYLVVRSTLTALSGASLSVKQSIWRGKEEMTRLALRLACLHRNGGVARLPGFFRSGLQDFLNEKAD